MLKLIALVVAVTVTGPGYSGTIEDRQVERLAAHPDRSEREVLKLLIERQWVEGEAVERGIVVTSQEAQAAFTDLREEGFGTRTAFRRFLRESGQTEADIKAAVRSDLLMAEIRAQVAEPAARSVTPDQVKAYVDANPQLTPATRTVRIVASDSRREAKAVLRKLRRGATFASVGGTKEELARQDHPAGPAIFRAPLSKTLRWGVYVFRVVRHAPARAEPRAQQEARAWETLAGEAQQRALDAFTAQLTTKWRLRTACAARYGYHEDCGEPPTGQEAA